MILAEFSSIWKTLRKQVASLKVPWLDELKHRRKSPYEILVACILSLRTKDDTTGRSSERLFRLARTPEEMSRLDVGDIRDAIYPVGFYRVKAERIRELSIELLRSHNGRVPDTMEALLSLKGVGRKTANLVLTAGYGKPGICVDTHVHRIANRWGLVKTKTPLETESTLRDMLPKRYWKDINPTLVPFGQHVCTPLSPVCSSCDIRDSCDRVGVKRHR